VALGPVVAGAGLAEHEVIGAGEKQKKSFEKRRRSNVSVWIRIGFEPAEIGPPSTTLCFLPLLSVYAFSPEDLSEGSSTDGVHGSTEQFQKRHKQQTT
jgi:hypothetical protein